MAGKPKLTDEQIQDVLAEYARTGNAEIRELIVQEFSGLVECVAWKYAGGGEPLEDLSQEGYIGLLGAIDQYDPSKGAKFSTYATYAITGRIKHYLRDRGKIIKEPAWLQEINSKMRRTVEELQVSLQREPSDTEIANAMNLTIDSIQQIRASRSVFNVVSLDGESNQEDSPGALNPETIKSRRYEDFRLPIEDRILVEESLRKLKEWEQRVVYAFFYMDLSQTEIARKFNISCNYASYLLRNGVHKLKKIIATSELVDAQLRAQMLEGRLQSIEEASIVDAISGVYTAHYFKERLAEEVSRAHRYNHSVAVVVIQVNGIESCCSTEVLRNQLLREVGETLKGSLRKSDLIARVDKDRFGIILPRTDENAHIVLERLCCVVEDICPPKGGQLTAQGGYAVFPSEAHDVNDLEKLANHRTSDSCEDHLPLYKAVTVQAEPV
jgi:RNA polymerase sigma-B factor